MHLSWGRIFYYTLEEEETQEVNVPQRGWFYFVCFIKFSQETYCTETSLLSLRDIIHRWQRRGTMQTLFDTDCGSHVVWLCGDSWSMIEHEDGSRNQRLQGAFKSLLPAISQKQQYACLPMRLYDCPWMRQNSHNKKSAMWSWLTPLAEASYQTKGLGSILNPNSHCRQQDTLTSLNTAIAMNSVSVFLESRGCRMLQSTELHSFNNGISKQDCMFPEYS